MSNDFFQFKQFLIKQDRCAMKVGTDGVLLGAWADIRNCQTSLDIGTGTGLISLMIAQRSDSKITAVEIDEFASNQAKENILNSKWKNRIDIFNISFQKFYNEWLLKFDLIVSNPPFFDQSFKPENENRKLARHTDQLSKTELLEGVNMLLDKSGKFCIILPSDQENLFVETALEYSLYCSRKCYIKPVSEIPPKRVILEFIRDKCLCLVSEIVVETNKRHIYTADYLTLTKEFYL